MTTFCPDTPSAWAEFNRMKHRLLNPQKHRHQRTTGESLNEALQHQISRENAMLRSLRSYLPGHEPDR